MTVRPKPLNPPSPRRSNSIAWTAWLDVMAIAAWSALLFRFWFTNKLNVLLHPDFMWLAHSTAVFLLLLSIWRAGQLLPLPWKAGQKKAPLSNPQHFTIFPPGLGSAILLCVAIIGLQFTPRPFASAVALERGVTDTLTMTRAKPQSFRISSRSEDRSVIDWVRTLNVYPEPDAYTGQNVDVEGFVIQPPDLPDSYFMIARFVITCCAADAYPVGLPVKLTGEQSAFPPDTWLRVRGEMITETLDSRRQLVIQASALEEIPEPDNPYEY